MTNYRLRNSYRPSYRSGFDPIIAVGLVVVLFVVSMVIFGVVNALHVETKTDCVVTDKDRTTNSDGDSDARIYTENCGVLHVADSLLSWQFNSADVYASIKEGETYDFRTRGFRVSPLSMFPNVIEVTPK